jgi:predicted GH43/DUF377 family glycosyl hydrolase
MQEQPIGEKVDVLLGELPRSFDMPGHEPPGWSIFREEWLCRDGLIVGVHPNPVRVSNGWLVHYETFEETTPEQLLATVA